jgi:hypothetical protein
MELINNYKEKESGQINSSATDSIYTLFKPHSAECCYIVGFHPEHPEYKADPWLVVTEQIIYICSRIKSGRNMKMSISVLTCSQERSEMFPD